MLGWCIRQVQEEQEGGAMPGLTLVCDLVSPIDGLLNDMERRGEGDSLSILWQDKHVALLSSHDPGYPMVHYETPDYLLWAEGCVYQAPESPWHLSLLPILADALSESIGSLDRAARWTEAVDGEFVIAVQDRRMKNIVILNDVLGRLPLYIRRTYKSLIVSRDLPVMIRLLRQVDFDRLAMAEHLLYGYPLGSRTLFKEIERVPPSAAIRIWRASKRIAIANVRRPAIVSDPCIREESLVEAADHLSSAFVRACAARAGGARNAVLSLSGGLDSRAVAAGLVAGQVPFAAVTRCTDPSEPDVRLAAKVASALQLKWRSVTFPRPTGSDLLRLLRLKSGMNHLGMAFILPFFDMLRSEFGSDIVFLTGDGGDKILPDHRPSTSVPNLEALVQYVLAKHRLFPLATVATLTGVPEVDIVGALREQLGSYPEDAMEDKHVHFVLFERGFKWLFEGEDRNRSFFWSTTPFYGRGPFLHAMNCPSPLKANYLLYRRFMESLNAGLVDVESTTCGPSMRPSRVSRHRVRGTLRRWSPAFVRRGWRKLTAPSVAKVLLDCMNAQLVSPSVTEVLSPSAAADLRLDRLERTQAYMLLTLTSTIEYFATGHSTLEGHLDTFF
jgi:asparagine synthase (glutamine-hydrolysing)